MRLLAALVAALAVTPPYLGRVISVASLPGDLRQAVLVLKAAGLVAEHTHAWIGGNTTLVQTGDIVAGGDEGKEIYELMFRLADEAPASGGKVVMLLGKHDFLNIEGDAKYVSRGDYEAFGGEEARRNAWGPDGWLGNRARQFVAAALVDGILFGHAGLLAYMIPDGGLPALNEAMYEALRGEGFLQDLQLRGLVGQYGPLWTRVFSSFPESAACPAVRQVLTRLAATRLVIGDTVQFNIRTRCGGRILLADTGMSHGGRASFVEYLDENAWAVYPPYQTRHLLPRPSQHPQKNVAELMQLRKARASYDGRRVAFVALVCMFLATAGPETALRLAQWQKKSGSEHSR